MKLRGKLILFVLWILLVFMVVCFAKASQPKVVGYTYASGNTVWEIASKHCPSGMKIENLVMEIEKLNGIEDSIIHKGRSYKVPVYECEYKSENDYLDMETVVGYEISDNGVMLLTNDGNGYFIEK